jgi:pyridoxal phosphate enzyme (YggS family)
MSTIEQRYLAVLQRVHDAATRCGRDPSDITIVAVTKTWPAETVAEAYRAGMRHFGENRAEEMAKKKAAVERLVEQGHSINWHQIGTVQSRKTGLVAANANVFHAMDRAKIAHRLSRAKGETGDALPILLEVNVSGETAKAGYNCSNWEKDATQLDELRIEAESIMQLPGLQLRGLMTMAPWVASPALIRSVFKRTAELATWLQTQFPESDLSLLSMGMTDDFEIAIEEGATHVRVGRAIFGSRN